MPDRVDARMQWMQPPRLDPPPYRCRSEPEREQLAPGDYAVLPRATLRKPLLDGSFSDIENLSSSNGHGPRMACRV